MARSKKSKAKSNVVKVDFEGVEGKRSRLPDDDYLVEVESVEVKEGAKEDYFEITMVVQSGPHKGSKIWDRASVSPNALWRLRSLLEVMGLEVPDGPMEIDPDDMVGTSFIAVTAQESYKSDDGKKIAVRMVDFYSTDDADEAEADEEEEEKPKKGKKEAAKPAKGKGKKAKDADEDEDEDEDEEGEEEEEETPEERKKRLRKERREKRKAKDEDEDAGEEEEEEKPKKKGKKEEPKAKKGKKAKKVSSDDVMEADEEELQELIDEHELDVDLDDYKTLRKKQAAVIDALEENDLLEE